MIVWKYAEVGKIGKIECHQFLILVLHIYHHYIPFPV